VLSAGPARLAARPLKIQLLDDSTDLTSDIAVHAIARLRKEGSTPSTSAAPTAAASRPVPWPPAWRSTMRRSSRCSTPTFVAGPDWLRRAMAAMLAHPRAAFVQTRIEWGNGEQNWLTRAQRLMQDAHFAVEQDVRARRGVPFPVQRYRRHLASRCGRGSGRLVARYPVGRPRPRAAHPSQGLARRVPDGAACRR
jgi:hypothetical protein